jgi:poly-gamma-glutamate synthesis protein (capsule biosynthesis protein)
LFTNGKPAQNKINLRSKSEHFLTTFKDKNPIAVCLANNHIMDYGEDAFLDTINFLRENNIMFFGAGNTENNFHNPCIINLDKHQIALLGYCCSTTSPVFGGTNHNGAAELDVSKISADIEAIKNSKAKIVLYLHWGDELIHHPKPSDVTKARLLIDSGADLIIGHHSHVIQSHEIYKGNYIFYGLGNFIFPAHTGVGYFNGNDFDLEYSSNHTIAEKKSLVVGYTNNSTVNYFTTFFDEKRVFKKSFSIPTWVPEKDRLYTLHRQYMKRRGTILRFIKNPKIPSKEQIKIFLGINNST